jgi:hypothetical protein
MRPISRIAGWASALIACADLPASAALPNQPVVLALRSLDQRVASVGHRLATANVAACFERQWHSGLLVHDLSQYSLQGRQEAAAAFGLDGGPAILAVAEGGPAERAQLRLNDVLLSADGAALPRAPAGAHGTFEPTEWIIEAIEAALADGRAELRIRRAGKEQTVRLIGELGCASRFQVVPSARRRAEADGRYVQLTSALIEYTRDDDELAALVAHELAHNILRHRTRLNAAGVDRGLFARFGRNARLFRQTEEEADRLAVYLMDKAGFDPRAAVRLWTRQSRDASPRAGNGTHPNWPSRIASLESEIRVIAAAKADGREPPLPAFATRLDPLSG